MSIKVGLRGNSQTKEVIDSSSGDKVVGKWKSVPILETQHEEVQKIQEYLKQEFDYEVTDLDICAKAMNIGLNSIKEITDWWWRK